MIKPDEIIRIGRFGKPHGINGEISASVDDNIDTDALHCIVTEIEGLYVPFFIESLRIKSTETLLLTIDGIDSDTEARKLTGLPVFALKRDNPFLDDPHDGEDGMYVADLVGFTVTAPDGRLIAEITGIEDSTENVLFIGETTDGSTMFIPVADEYIESIDTENKTITMDLPEGLESL